jgi:hypothetical protein
MLGVSTSATIAKDIFINVETFSLIEGVSSDLKKYIPFFSAEANVS